MKKILLIFCFLFLISIKSYCGYSVGINTNPADLFFSAGVNTTTGVQYVTVTGHNYDAVNYTISVTGSNASFIPSLSALYLPASGSFTSVLGISFTSGSMPEGISGSLAFSNTILGYNLYYEDPIKLKGAVLPYPTSCVVNTYSDANTVTGVGTISGNYAVGDLRYCIMLANSTYASATITFNGLGSTTLNAPLPNLINDVSLISSGGTTISGAGQYPVFINTSGYTLSGMNLTLINSYNTSNGGAIYNNGGILILNYCNLYNNTSTGGGGAIETNGLTYISNCNFLYNQCSTYGGAVQQGGNKGNFYVSNSTFAYNGSTNRGGSVFDLNSDSTKVINSTFYANYSNGNDEGAIWSDYPLTLINCSIYNNTSAGYGALDAYGNTTLINTIVANNYDLIFAGTLAGINDVTPNSPITTMSGHNIFTSTVSGISDGINGNIINATIGGSLFSNVLSNNGGNTWTLPITTASPAFNAGISVSGIPLEDQRGLPDFGAKDIGAYEFQGYPQVIAGFGPFETFTLNGVNTLILTATATNGSVTYTVNGPAVVNGSTLSITGPGTITLMATQAGNGIYAAVSDTFSFASVKAGQQIQGINTSFPFTLGGVNTLVLNTSATSGLTVTYTVQGPGILNGSLLSITGLGVVTITAFQAGNDTYNAITVTSFITVVQSGLTGINSDVENPTYLIYPNPNKGTFTIETGVGFTEVSIYNTVGEIVYQGNVSGTTQLKLASKGLHIIKLSHGFVNTYKKIILE